MNWKNFWQNYRLVEIKSDEDLLYQVGLTVKGKPISQEQLETIIKDAAAKLNLNFNDQLLDLCCGNGLITYQLASYVNSAIGIDISEPFIENAKRYKSKANLEYMKADVVNFDKLIDIQGRKFSKVFMYGSLAYFSKTEALSIFRNIRQFTDKDSLIFIGNILDKERIWNFYNTPQYKFDYIWNQKILKRDPAVGKWWGKKELSKIALESGLIAEFFYEDPILHTAHYRIDMVLKHR